jgi:hypothetical protein
MLESLKKEAKRWLQALRTNDAAALAALPEHTASAVNADNARRPAGARTGTRFRRLDGSEGGCRDRAARFGAGGTDTVVSRKRVPRSSCPHAAAHARAEATAMRLLAAYPEIAHDSFSTEVVCGHLAAVDRMLADRPSAASTPCEIADLARQEPAGDD